MYSFAINKRSLVYRYKDLPKISTISGGVNGRSYQNMGSIGRHIYNYLNG